MKIQRLDSVDALRGLAMVWMTAFHFSFDLNHFGYIQQNFYSNPFWTVQRTLIVSLFLFCAGLGQSIAVAQGQSWSRFWRRWAQIVACALLVTAGSWWMFPQTFIYFGVLHGMTLMLIVARLTASWGRWLWLLGGLAIASKFIAASALNTWAGGQFSIYFNAPMLNWIGWITRLPVTEDYVPVFPWLGVMWWGLAAGNWLMQSRPEVMRLKLATCLQPSAVLGRWSLSYYMLHQPVMIGLLSALAWLMRSGA
ncbi:heparan-alpha-glucosaminide N-acetyltransferase [Rhodoferax sp.]|uniref:heparan-alpha-glucosaminide N-acetyltransferase n=1 Tax=Rhodoferax sp. TaxID=50421 RepID=UPI00284F97DA|nr:heparan-alpha-glucosaminide N-acetyltransferase [Rhodoferax sp.]MDR3368346.1 heparan-alpha-glucosaminide N-acetyltransferase [Rhodoferax sp.]